jgi:hypothetical protein
MGIQHHSFDFQWAFRLAIFGKGVALGDEVQGFGKSSKITPAEHVHSVWYRKETTGICIQPVREMYESVNTSSINYNDHGL